MVIFHSRCLSKWYLLAWCLVIGVCPLLIVRGQHQQTPLCTDSTRQPSDT